MAELGRVLPLNQDEILSHANIISLLQLKDHDSLWQLLCEIEYATDQSSTLDMELDSALNWNIQRYTSQNPDNTKRTVEFEFSEFLGSTIATKRTTTTSNGEHSELVVRLLDDAGADEVCLSFEAALRESVLHERRPMAKVILKPQYLATIWPFCGLCLWCVGRRRIRAARAEIAEPNS